MDGETSPLVEPEDPEAMVEAIVTVARDPGPRSHMGEVRWRGGRKLSTPERGGAELLETPGLEEG